MLGHTHLFITLDVNPPSLPNDPQVLEQLPDWLKQSAEDDDRTSALSYLLDDSIPGVVLIGGPGEGKSTLGQYLAQIYRAHLLGRLNELEGDVEVLEQSKPYIPFKILLREYAQWVYNQNTSDSLFHYLAIQVSCESGRDAKSEDIQDIIKSNPVILILDGLDEVPEKGLRMKVLDNVTSFVNQVRDVLEGNLRVIATTRPQGYSQEFDPAHYLHLTLQKLSSKKASSYAKRWADARELNPRESERIHEAFNTCIEDAVVRVLTQTPLQVTILLVIIHARGAPPKQREELFEEYMGVIYQREQKKRPELLRTDKDTIYGLHKYLAYMLHRRAEADKTAALMDVSEFRESVREYLTHGDPLLEEEELKSKLDQIIDETRQRMVLIESPQEGKVGFSLTTTREFFAAAHLVDTAENTEERDLRFKAIIKSPHWCNTALFFAGRVGRTRPGEAPSMIDVCRGIDKEGVDKFLKRGAGLVMGMVDDRVLRVPYNEAAAIEYGLTLLDSGLTRGSDEFLNKLKSLRDEDKGRVVRPWMENQLNRSMPENLEIYADIYQKLFGASESLHRAIKRASESDSEDVKLWALSRAIKNKIVEPWVIDLLEELVDTFPIENIAQALGDYWFNVRFYLGISLSSKARTVIALALFIGTEKYGRSFKPLPSEAMDELSMIKPDGTFKENSLLLWAASQLLILFHRYAREEIPRSGDWSLWCNLPGIVNPSAKAILNENANFIKEFCETFSYENEPFTKLLVSVFEFLLEPHNPEKYVNISRHLQWNEESVPPSTARIVSSILGVMPEDEEMLCEYHKDLYTLYEHYRSEEQYRTDIKEFSELINRDSGIVTNHQQKLHVWMNSNGDPAIEKFLDPEILTDVKKWFRQRSLSENAPCLYRFSLRLIDDDDLELCKLILESADKQLADGRKHLTIGWEIPLYYKWHEPKTEQEVIVAERLKYIFEKVLKGYSTLSDPHYHLLDTLYWSVLDAGIAEERYMSELYKLRHYNADLTFMPWYARRAENVRSMLVNLLQSSNLEVARLAAVSLSAISQVRFFRRGQKTIKETWIAEKFWEFARDEEDIWRTQYIRGMAHCRLKWEEKYEEWIEVIEEANTEELQSAWHQVIEKAGYCEAKDRDALCNLLLHILESGDTFAKPIRFAALRRLDEMVTEVEPVGFDEEALNLPLSRR